MRRMILGLFFLCLGTAGVAAADPVTLTTGTMGLYPDFSLATIEAAGSGFSVGGSGLGGFLGTFNAGQTVDLSRRIAFTPRVQDTGTMTINGQEQHGFVGIDVQMNATPFVAPAMGSTTGFSTPFTLTGFVQLFTTAPAFGGTPIFTQSVTGSGTVGVGGIWIGDSQFFANGGLTARFAPAGTPSPTPEPASLLLLGSGLLAAWQSRPFRRA